MDKRLLQLGKIIRKRFNDGNEPGCLDLVNGQQADPVFHKNPFSWPWTKQKSAFSCKKMNSEF